MSYMCGFEVREGKVAIYSRHKKKDHSTRLGICVSPPLNLAMRADRSPCPTYSSNSARPKRPIGTYPSPVSCMMCSAPLNLRSISRSSSASECDGSS